MGEGARESKEMQHSGRCICLECVKGKDYLETKRRNRIALNSVSRKLDIIETFEYLSLEFVTYFIIDDLSFILTIVCQTCVTQAHEIFVFVQCVLTQSQKHLLFTC
jgi:hypothetical protein